MADVFVSYARIDEPQAERVAEALRADGYRAGATTSCLPTAPMPRSLKNG